MANNPYFGNAPKPKIPNAGDATLGTVSEGLSSVNTALLNSPTVASTGTYNKFFSEASKLAAGKPTGQGGVLGTIGGLGIKTLSTLGEVLGTPARVVASTLKETADLIEGDGFSTRDWAKQVSDKDFYMSKIIGKTGNSWVDGFIGFGADVLTDPLTWVGLGGASRASRVALAAEAATLPIFANAPAKINQIARLGNLAKLTPLEREALGEAGKLGMRAQFGAKNLLFDPEGLLGKGSAAVSSTVGRGLGVVRANIGDIIPAKVRMAATPKSYRIIGELGRKGAIVSGVEALARAASHSANLRKQAEASIFESLSRGEYRDVISAIDAYPNKDTLYQVADGTRVATDDFEQGLADSWKRIQDEVRVKANDFGKEVSGRRGISIQEIGYRADYGVNHSITEDAFNYMNSSKAGQSKWSTELAQLTGMTKADLETGKGIVRMRKLNAKDTFLGKVLDTGSIDEINAISRDRLGFDLFKTDASSLVRDYISSASDQVGRVAFVDRLLDYSPEVFDKVAYKVVPQEGVASLSKVVRKLEVARNGLSRNLDKLDASGLKVADGTLARAETSIAAGTVNGETIRSARRLLGRDVKAARVALSEAEAMAAKTTGEIRASYETVLQPLRERIAALESHIAQGNAIEQASMEVLAPMFARIFPDVPIPSDVKVVAKSILDAKGLNVTELQARIAAGEQGLERTLGATKGALTKTEGVVTPAVEAATTAKGKAVIAGRPTKGGVPTIGPIYAEEQTFKDAIKELQVAKNGLAKAETQMQKAISTETKKILDEPIKARTKAISAFDAKQALYRDQVAWERNVKPKLLDSVEEIRAAKVAKDGGMTDEWLRRTDDVLKQINDPKILNPAQRQAWDTVFTGRQSAEAELVKAENTYRGMAGMLDVYKNPPNSFYGNIVPDIKKGWVELENMGIQMPKEISDMLFAKIDKLNTVKGLKEYLGFMTKFNQYFRVSAMLTPGFIVRNAMTAAFNNFVYGATFRDTDEAIRFATVLHRRGAKAALASLDNVETAVAERAYKAMLASGVGQTEDIIQPLMGERSVGKLLNSRVVKGWSTANHDTEVAARMAMALRGAKNGLTIDQIAADIARYHFNYGDLSQLDEVAKMFIPFWTFASKNIPLQIANQLARPSVYRAYESVKRQMPVDENMILPNWLAARDPLGAGSGGVINPDLPQVDMADQLRQFSDPLRLASQMYPQFRLPIELLGDRKLSTAIPFSDKPQAVRGITDLPSLLLSALTGQTVDTATGTAMTSKGAYVLPQAIPFLGTLQRLLPQLGGDARLSERQGSSWAGALGVPYRAVPEEEQQRTLTGREIALQNYLKEMQRRGYIE